MDSPTREVDDKRRDARPDSQLKLDDVSSASQPAQPVDVKLARANETR